ncbi:ImmA/IrrE family metallo-endopeptidase [Pseudoalteromonas sp. BDTF-M6]|uniref:ImmA/IrrE family metallo-endopeptidase n=1 Tax=Pseudoalteromonas sp. BDTF-M6 TaxID=2796132 RepID=UPI001BAEC4DD|nr:ImmA/IrrE family metallo-endopeptidase [Pseudoalteromonas sp. BDTF-M6]MBS3797174.1 ImmA/IrrE family metallo-endopeptidase [Pseudoalteromonas sp. BDTF-M6]
MNLDPNVEAKKVLDRLWCNQGFPVDPVSIAQKMGLQVLDTDLPPTVSGALIKEAGADPIIALHYADHSNRKRFTCAHELGHYVSRIESNDDNIEYEYVDLRGSVAASGCDSEEIFANRFAASLLMPEKVVREHVKSGKSHFESALFFGVSNEALKHRLKNLGLL